MSVEVAKSYFRIADDPDGTADDLADLYAEDAVLLSPREGVFRGRDEIREFFRLNGEFFDEGGHDLRNYFTDGDTVICEGTITGTTSAGRSYEGVGFVDVVEFEDDEIIEFRIYLDYSGLYTELPDDVPDYRLI